MHVASLLGLVSEAKNIHPSRQSQIASLDVKEVTIPAEYLDYTNVFSLDSAAELVWRTYIAAEALPFLLKCQFRQEEVCFLGYVVSSQVVLTFSIASRNCLG